MVAFFAPCALLPDGWATDVRLEVDSDGILSRVRAGADSKGATRLSGPVIPGMINAHSHAFQRAMAGHGEVAPGPGGSFWSWRQTMFRLAARIDPDGLEATATWLYIEMLKAGTTTVCEFHYLHNDPGGAAYDTPALLSERILAAADSAGIALTHLPVLYRYSDFGGQPPAPEMARFVTTPDAYAVLVESLKKALADNPLQRIGLAPHSLRAVGAADFALLEQLRGGDSGMPVHIHIAEQLREVEGCLAASGQRPVAWLLDNAAVDDRWCLVHATHMDDSEVAALAVSGAVAGLCPSTEGNLGDGFFPLPAWLAAGGKLAFGSDSNTSVNPFEELRWLEYGQRLRSHRRPVAATPGSPSPGGTLWCAALTGGARVSGQPVGALAPGKRADFLVLDGNHPALCDKQGDGLLDGAVFAASYNPVRDVYIAGRRVIGDRHHAAEEAAFSRFAATLADLRRAV